VIKFRCQDCQKKIGVPDSYAGLRVKCPQCGRTLAVPSAAPVIAGEGREQAPAPSGHVLVGAVGQETEPICRESAPISPADPDEPVIQWSEDFIIPAVTPAAPPPAASPPKTCPRCGAAMNAEMAICVGCGGILNPTVLAPGVTPVKTTFREDLLRLLAPIHSIGDGFIFFFLLIISIAMNLNVPGGGIFLLMGRIMASGYFCAYMFSVIVETAGGEDKLPSLPGVTSYWEDIVRPYLCSLASFIYAFLPMLVAAAVYGYKYLALQWEGEDAVFDPQGFRLIVILGIVGLFIWPMVILGLALGDNLATIRPDLVFRSIIGTIGPYSVCCACLYLCAMVMIWSERSFRAATGDSMGMMVLRGIGGQVGALCLSLYGMRLMGLLYRHYKHRLAWAFE
jgi:hypothetical protein